MLFLFFSFVCQAGVRIQLHMPVLWSRGTHLGVFSSQIVPYGLRPRVGLTGSSLFLFVDVGVEDDNADGI